MVLEKKREPCWKKTKQIDKFTHFLTAKKITCYLSKMETIQKCYGQILLVLFIIHLFPSNLHLRELELQVLPAKRLLPNDTLKFIVPCIQI